MSNSNLEIRLLSSLEKVFADEVPSGKICSRGSMLRNEVYSFQAAYAWNEEIRQNVQIKISSALASLITVRMVGLVPSEMPCYLGHDDNVLRTVPGLYPDILLPISHEGFSILPCQWRALWFAIEPAGEDVAGVYPIEISFLESTGEELGKATFHIEILEASLPEQKLIHTEWFHSDCIATYYGIEVFSEEHWRRIEQFIVTAVKHGINMILTPVFTPPLDTAVGGERSTVQLVDVYKSQDKYTFGFTKLKRWIDMCLSNGVEYFEFSHLFTQWGAKHAPKIMAEENGELKRIFGWDTDAGGEEYSSFLFQFLPELIAFIEKNGLKERSYLHVSDEPGMENIPEYKKASSIMNKFLTDYPIIDALSEYEFYETGVIKNPIPSTERIKVFLDHNVPDLWAYYCGGQFKKVSNRFFNFPSARNRILGIQLYKFNIKGFLQWGYNFWYSQYSRIHIDPFRVSDAACTFLSGDSYVVYPGKDGPLVSLRFEVFYEGLQDLRALELLEKCIGRDAVLDMLDKGLETPITFDDYPKEPEWLLSKREEINKEIIEADVASGL